ncbi:MAG: cation-translocating P-type ATPase [Candidatus Nanohaloarchaea archaeon]
MAWYSSSSEEVLEDLETSEDGLGGSEAERRLEEHGRNKIQKGDSVSPLKILISQFQDTLIYLLVLAAAISIGIGLLPGHSPEYTDAALIFLILIANGIFGFIQDYRAEKSIEALKDLSTPDATVMRGGEKQEIDATEVVPGDILVIEQGDAIPADARVIESKSLATDESALTGESQQVSKSVDTLDEGTALADRTNMVYKNTTAVKGRGRAVVVETGMETQVGGIASQIEEADDKKTPFQEEVDNLGRSIGYGIIAVIGLVALTQLGADYLGPSNITLDTLVTVLLVSITLAVAAVPEGLPAVVTLTLALGSKKMLKKNALVRSLPVVESLGSVDVIVTDKTGTLTEGTMTVKKLYYQSEEIEVTGTGTETEGRFLKDGSEVDSSYLEPLLRTGYICNNSEKAPEDEDKDFFGEPTEIALKVSALKSGLEFDDAVEREIPFSSDRKRMTVVSGGEALMKGAPEVVLKRCDRMLVDGEEVELDEEKRNEILEKNQEFAGDALRVLGFARKAVEDVNAEKEEVENDMVFLGLQGMIDPPRKEVKGAVDDCRNAGINVVMATGDNIETAKAIGKQIGFSPENALTGPEVEQMSQKELEASVEETEIFARVSPEHKVKILQALQENDHNVAMTGDGVNDAPALKNSDVGIAMGQRGTDVAQQSSDMVLQDDNFVTIRDAIEEGRGIFDNIRKFVNYLLSANAGEVLVVFGGVLIGSSLFQSTFSAGESALILTPVMLLWINLVTDGLPALALGTDPASEGIMERPPRGQDEPVINRRMMASILGIGALIAVAGLPLFFQALSESLVKAQTVLFTFLVSVEMVRIQTIRSRYGQSLLSNNWLVAALGSSFALQLLVLYTPLARYFGTYSLGLEGWGLIAAGAAAFAGMSFGTGKLLDRFA